MIIFLGKTKPNIFFIIKKHFWEGRDLLRHLLRDVLWLVLSILRVCTYLTYLLVYILWDILIEVAKFLVATKKFDRKLGDITFFFSLNILYT